MSLAIYQIRGFMPSGYKKPFPNFLFFVRICGKGIGFVLGSSMNEILVLLRHAKLMNISYG